MESTITVSSEDLIRQVKRSFQFPSLIKGLIAHKVISSMATELGISAETDELQKAADSVRLVNGLQRAEDTWSWLKKHELSLDEFEELIHHTVISSKLAQHLFASKVEPFFIEHQLDYLQIVMYEVVLDDEELAIELFYEIQEKDNNFHEIAHQYIENPELRRNGGYKGILHRKDLKPEIAAAVFAATPPQVIKPIVTSKGAHLILVEEIVQPSLDEKLHQSILSNLFNSWLHQQIGQVEVINQ